MRNIIAKAWAGPKNLRSRGDEGPMAEAHEFHAGAHSDRTPLFVALRPGRMVRRLYSSLGIRIEGIHGSWQALFAVAATGACPDWLARSGGRQGTHLGREPLPEARGRKSSCFSGVR